MDVINSNQSPGKRYRLVLRGELGQPFSFLFEGMQMDRLAGTTVLTGTVIDQAHLHGLLERIQDLGIDSCPWGQWTRRQMDDQKSS